MAMEGNLRMDKSALLRHLELQGITHFTKILTTTSGFSENGSGPIALSLPQSLVLQNSMEELMTVYLGSEYSTSVTWPVTISAYGKSKSHQVRQVKLATGWNAFADFHRLWKGDELVFAVSARDQFYVYVFHAGTGQRMKELSPSQAVPGKRSGTHFKVSTGKKAKEASSKCKTVGEEVQAPVIPALVQHHVGPSSCTLSSIVSVPDEPEISLNLQLQKDVRVRLKAMDIGSMAVDIKELGDAYVYVADMPGPKSTLDIQVQLENGNVLVIGGSRKREEAHPKVKYIQIERNYGSFMRKLELPQNANLEKIGASFSDGVLTITIAKIPPPESAKPRIIEVNMGSG